MAQNQVQAQQQMAFAPGTGVVRSKIGAMNTSIIFGRIAVPGFGQCYVDGLIPAGSKVAVLDVKAVTGKERRIIATIEMPAGDMKDREGKLMLTPAPGKKTGKVYKLRAQIRENANGHHMALRLPEVKIQQSSAFGVGPRNNEQ